MTFVAAMLLSLFVPAQLDICQPEFGTAPLRLIVSPAHMGKGIGSWLVRKVEAYCMPCLKITVSTAWRNTPAVRLYEKCGYSIERRWFLPDGLELVGLQKIIVPAGD